MVQALIKLVQDTNEGADGCALVGDLADPVTITNVNNTGVASWEIQLLAAPPGSALTAGILAQGNGATPLGSFLPDVNGGCYRIQLRVWPQINRGGTSDTDIRNFAVPGDNGLIVPPPQIWPEPLPDPRTGRPGAKANEMNFGGDADTGWCGNGSDGLLAAAIAAIGADGAGFLRADGTVPLSATWPTGNRAFTELMSLGYNGEVDNTDATPVINFTTGDLQRLTLNANATPTFVAPLGVAWVQVRAIGDGTPRTITWPLSVVGTPPAPSAGVNVSTFYLFFYDGTNYHYIADATVTAGNGLTGTGVLSVLAADSTIVVGAGGIKRAPITGDAVIADGSNVSVIDNLALSKLAQASGRGVIGRISDTPGDWQELLAFTDGHVFRALVGDVGWGALDLANANTFINQLPDAKLASVFVKANGTVPFAAEQSMGGFRLTNVGTPTADADAATKAYVDGIASGLNVKTSVDVVSTTNIASLSGLATTIDGVLQNVDGKRVLLTGQTTASQNGPWEVHSGAWTRPADFAAGADAAAAFFFVQRGTVFADTGWVCTANTGSAVVGTDNLPFAQFSAAGVVTVDASLVKTGNQLSRAALTGDVTAPAGSNTTTIADNAVTLAKLATQLARSVLANATNAAAAPTAVQGTDGGAVFRVNDAGTGLAFGQLNLSLSAAVTGTLPQSRGGTGFSGVGGTANRVFLTTDGTNGVWSRVNPASLEPSGTDGRVLVTVAGAATWGTALGNATDAFSVAGDTVSVSATTSFVLQAASGSMLSGKDLGGSRRVMGFFSDVTTTLMPANTGDNVAHFGDAAIVPTTGATGFPNNGGIFYVDPTLGLSFKGKNGVETTLAPHGDSGNTTKRRMIGVMAQAKRTQMLTATGPTLVASFDCAAVNGSAVTTGTFKVVAHYIAKGVGYHQSGEILGYVDVVAGTPSVGSVQDPRFGTDTNGGPFSALLLDNSGTTVRLMATTHASSGTTEVFACIELMEFEP